MTVHGLACKNTQQQLGGTGGWMDGGLPTVSGITPVLVQEIVL